MAMLNCRHFRGDRPCGLNDKCDLNCSHLDEVKSQILIIHLEALGAVLRATSLLGPIKRSIPGAKITWVTQAPADQLLRSNPLLDRILTTRPDDLLALSSLEFDVAYVIDKSLKANGVLRQTKVGEVRGFIVDGSTGAIIPANSEAQELWDLGLSNHKKFFVNQKPETQLLTEAMGHGPWSRDPYVVRLTMEERNESTIRRRSWAPRGEKVIGINTGCSGVIPYKKLSVSFQREMIAHLIRRFDARIVLLGGPEDTVRNQQIGEGLPVILSATERGLRDGLISVDACDLVITGDSLGMHMAIALEKFTVAWFGPTCAQEIDLYNRGVKILAKVDCSPCWRRSCSNAIMCYERVDLEEIIAAVELGLSGRHETQTSRQSPEQSPLSSI